MRSMNWNHAVGYFFLKDFLGEFVCNLCVPGYARWAVGG